jgi:hypothetical protein
MFAIGTLGVATRNTSMDKVIYTFVHGWPIKVALQVMEIILECQNAHCMSRNGIPYGGSSSLIGREHKVGSISITSHCEERSIRRVYD